MEASPCCSRKSSASLPSDPSWARLVTDLQYHVTVLITRHDEDRFSGRVEVSFALSELPSASEPISFGSLVEIRTVHVNGNLQSAELTEELGTGSQKIDSGLLAVGNNKVVIDFDGIYTKENQKFGKFESELGTGVTLGRDSNGIIYAFTQCEPDYTKRIFPVFEVLVLKAKYSLRMVCPAEVGLIANNSILSKVNLSQDPQAAKSLPEHILKGLERAYEAQNPLIESGEETPYPGYHVLETGQSPVISFTLFAFVIGDFATFESPAHTYEGWPLKLHALKDDKDNLEKYADRLWEITKTGLDFYEKYFDCKMPYAKLDQVFLPRFRFNGMENPGCIFLSNNNLVSQPKLFSIFNRDRLILHEIGHMWLGNLISMNQFHNIWLKESCVEFFCHKAFQHVFPSMGSVITSDDCISNLIIRGSSTYAIEKFPFTTNSYPLCFSQESYQDHLVDYYGRIVYQKGSTYIRSLLLLLGEEIFQKLFRSLMANYKERNYSDEDFKTLVQSLIKEHGSEELLSRFNLWFRDHIHLNGYNILKADDFSWDSTTGTASITLLTVYLIWADIEFAVYGSQGRLLKRFTFNPLEEQNAGVTADRIIKKPGTNIHQITIQVSGITEQPAAVVPNSNFNGLMQVGIGRKTFEGLFKPGYGFLHKLPQVERTVIYHSLLAGEELGARFAEQHWAQAAAIADPSPYLSEVYANNFREAHANFLRAVAKHEDE